MNSFPKDMAEFGNRRMERKKWKIISLISNWGTGGGLWDQFLLFCGKKRELGLLRRHQTEDLNLEGPLE